MFSLYKKQIFDLSSRLLIPLNFKKVTIGVMVLINTSTSGLIEFRPKLSDGFILLITMTVHFLEKIIVNNLSLDYLTFKTMNSKYKVSTTCRRKNNQDPSIPTVLFFYQGSFWQLFVGYFIAFLKTNINHEKKNTNIFFYGRPG